MTTRRPPGASSKPSTGSWIDQDEGRGVFLGGSPFELVVFDFIYDPHPAPADLLEDPVFAGDKASRLQDVDGRLQRLSQRSLLSPWFP